MEVVVGRDHSWAWGKTEGNKHPPPPTPHPDGQKNDPPTTRQKAYEVLFPLWPPQEAENVNFFV